jgi:uncharacterized coiled-coil protein SlyX
MKMFKQQIEELQKMVDVCVTKQKELGDEMAVEKMKVDKFQVQLNPIIQKLFNNSSQSLDGGIMEVFSYIENHIWGEV